MRDFILVILMMGIIGCTFSRQMEVTATGTNVESIYGSGSLNTGYKSNTTTGFLNGRN